VLFQNLVLEETLTPMNYKNPDIVQDRILIIELGIDITAKMIDETSYLISYINAI